MYSESKKCMGIVLDLSYICILYLLYFQFQTTTEMVNYSDCDCDHKFQWKEGKCKHENPISQLNPSNYQSERWKVTEWNFSGPRMLSGEAAALCPRWPHCPPGRSGEEYDDGPKILKYFDLFPDLFHFRSWDWTTLVGMQVGVEMLMFVFEISC